MRSLFEHPSRDLRFREVPVPSRLGLAALLLATSIALCIIVAHAALIPLGNWRYDEYDTFRYIREGGLPFVWDRIVGWSPRPLSEIVLYGYGNLVQLTAQPNVGLLLGLLWLLLIACVMGPTLRLLKQRSTAFLPIAVLSVATLAMFLVGHRIDEVFYWTQGAAAYIMTLAAIAAIAMIHVCTEDVSRADRSWTNGLAVVAAFSSEMGASFAIVYGSLMLVADCLGTNPSWKLVRSHWSDLTSLIPVIAGLSIFYLAAGGRLGTSMEAVGDPAILHQIIPSLVAAIQYTPGELLSLGPATTGAEQYIWGVMVAIGFCGGAFGLFAASGIITGQATSLRLLFVGLAALAAVLVSVLAAYYQFGLVCCSRHETMRRCLAIVAAVCLVASAYSLVAGRLKSGVGRGWVIVVSCILIIASMGASSIVTFPLLFADLRNYRQLSAASAANWESGMAADRRMDYLPSRSEMICSPGSLSPGDYRLGENMPPHVAYIARYFGKSEVVITGIDEACRPL